MSRQIVTANRLSDGRVVYFTADDAWSEWLEEALVAPDAEAGEALLARGEACSAITVVEPYLIELDGSAGIAPRRYRERIRASGPTVRHDLGKQALRREGEGES